MCTMGSTNFIKPQALITISSTLSVVYYSLGPSNS